MTWLKWLKWFFLVYCFFHIVIFQMNIWLNGWNVNLKWLERLEWFMNVLFRLNFTASQWRWNRRYCYARCWLERRLIHQTALQKIPLDSVGKAGMKAWMASWNENSKFKQLSWPLQWLWWRNGRNKWKWHLLNIATRLFKTSLMKNKAAGKTCDQADVV